MPKKEENRNNQLCRVLRSLNILEHKRYGMTVKELWRALEERGLSVSERTVDRDLKGMMKAGFPLQIVGEDVNRAQKWALDKSTKVGEYLSLTMREIMALHLARSILTPVKETPFFDDLQSLFNKIEDKLSKSHLY